jgi:hypothetical protein
MIIVIIMLMITTVLAKTEVDQGLEPAQGVTNLIIEMETQAVS